jgi:FG-GAP-like repeat/FG-GAP repeat
MNIVTSQRSRFCLQVRDHRHHVTEKTSPTTRTADPLSPLRSWFLVCFVVLGCPGFAQDRLLLIESENTNDAGVRYLDAVGDIDKDGVSDLVIFYPGANTPNGPLTSSVVVYSGRDGRELFRMLGKKSNYPLSVAGVGDVNRDGIPDVAVGGQGTLSAGNVTVLSGKDGSVLRFWSETHPNAYMGYSLASAGDLNRDGYADVLVGYFFGTLFDPRAPRKISGEVRVYSGKDGKVLLRYVDGLDNHVGFSVANAGDIDRDGYEDYYAAGIAGPIYLISGKTGKLLRTIDEPKSVAKEFGTHKAFANIGDVDRDGVPDLGWSGFRSSPTASNTGMFLVISNKSGALLHTIVGKALDYMGGFAVGLGDIDKDGYADFATSSGQAHTTSTKTGFVTGYSGKTGKEIFRFYGEHPNQNFGSGAVLLNDMTGDGKPEIAIASQWPKNPNGTWGRTEIFSVADLALTARPSALSLKQAGSQSIRIDVGKTQANQNYWVFGSVTGVTPGTSLPGITIPLNFDYYTQFTIGSPGGPFFSRFRGVLDASGQASAKFIVPSGLPKLPDFTLYHAAVVFQSNGQIRAVTNPVTLRLRN